MRQLIIFSAIIAWLAATGCASKKGLPKHGVSPDEADRSGPRAGSPAGQDERLAPLLQGMGKHHYGISTSRPLAQRYFDQGLTLAYGFNHAEAERSFRQAAELDPQCAMCYWGMALVLGPNINAPMAPESEPRAWEAVQTALSLADTATAKERALIKALAERYAPAPEGGKAAAKRPTRAQLDRAYADAMRQVYRTYPDDPDIAALFAESLMDIHPWDYWQAGSRPQPWTPEILEVLEGVLASHPEHPAANHYYIHAVEASANPERALASAKRLSTLVPGVGHLVHMPAHIYIRLGRYADASASNLQAIAADEAYFAQIKSHANSLYPLAYYPHNIHFLFASAAFEGRSELAMKAARQTRAQVQREKMGEPGWSVLQHYYVMPLYAMVRFGLWDTILLEPDPDPEQAFVYPRIVWHYARGMAFRGQGNLAEAERELAALRTLRSSKQLQDLLLWSNNPAITIADIAAEILAGEITAKRKRYKQAIAHLERAVSLEGTLSYTEPTDWYYPARHNLGAVLLEAGQPKAAEQVYRRDLEVFPNNGWSLIGLAQSLEAQGKTREAAAVRQRFERAWAAADIKIEASRF